MGERVDNLEKQVKELEEKVKGFVETVNSVIIALENNDIFMKVPVQIIEEPESFEDDVEELPKLPESDDSE